MTNAKTLSTRQFAVIDDLFDGDLEEQAMREKHKFSRKLYDKLLVDEDFISRLDWHIAWGYRRSEFMLARYARVAVSNLVRLTECETPETARKACIDIITMRANRLTGTPATPDDNPTSSPKFPQLSPKTVGKLLADLAEEKPLCIS